MFQIIYRGSLFIVLCCLVGCVTLPSKDPTFALKKVTIIERADGTTLQVQKEFDRVTEKEFNMLSDLEKAAWRLLKRQVGL